MAFRFMQLQYERSNSDAKIKHGIVLKRSRKHMYQTRFGIIESIQKPEEKDLKISVFKDFIIEQKKDGFKNVKIFCKNKDNTESCIEEFILILVEYAGKIDCSGEKVAGIYQFEGLFLLKDGDTIYVETDGSYQRFKAVSIDQKMYLVKLYSDE